MISKSEIGGAQYWVANFITSLDMKNFEVVLITNQPGWLSDRLTSLNIRTIYIEDLDKIKVTNFLKVYNQLLKINADCVIANSAFAGFYGRVCGYLVGVPAVYVSHGWSALYTKSKISLIYKVLENLLSWLSREIWCVSIADMAKAKSRLRINEKKLRHVKLKIPDVQPDGRVNDDKSCLFVARFCQPKRGDILIQAINEIGCQLVAYGDGALKEEWSDLDKKNLVEFKGFAPVVPYSQKFGIYALISDSEGLPVSAIEAMRAGMPLVLSNVGGCAELIDGNGFAVNNSIKEVAQALETTYAKYEIFSHKSRNNFLIHHSINADPQYYEVLVLKAIHGVT